MAAANLQKLLQIYLKPFQDLEDVFFQLLTLLSIDKSSGVQLDIIGTLLGAGRQGDSDTRYKVRLQAQTLINRSKGTAPEIMRVLKLLSPDKTFTVIVDTDAGFSVQISGTPSLREGEQLATAIAQMKAAGVRSVTLFSPPGSTFVFGGGFGTGFGAGFSAAR